MKLRFFVKASVPIVLLVIFVSCHQEDQERIIKQNEIPQVVLQAFSDSYPGATVKEYAEETEDGQKIFEISCDFEGRAIDASYKGDGALMAVEEVIPAQQLPEIVHQAIFKEIPQFSIERVEKIQEAENTFYEIKLLSAKDQQKYELKFSEDGVLVEKKMKKEHSEETNNEN